MRIEHAALYVRDLKGARDFFVRYFGADVGPLYHNPRTGFRSYFLSLDEGARLELMCRPGLADGEKDLLQGGLGPPCREPWQPRRGESPDRASGRRRL